ncbi:MAG: ABC transporter permease [Azospirillaceae bacterium]
MLRTIGSRLLQVPIALLGMTLIVFLFVTASGDPVLLLADPGASDADLEAMRRELGFDRPWIVQYLSFLGDALTGDFGTSFRHRLPAMDFVLGQLPATLELAAASLVIATAISIPLGITAARNKGKPIDLVATMVAVLGQSMPVFWLGMLLILAFAVALPIFPVGGRGTLAHLVLPAVTLGWYFNALITRMVRSTMLETLNQNYVRTARAKGVPERRVVMRHAFRNAQVPIITVWGLQAGNLLTGTVVAETVFSWPGLGRASVAAVLARDIPVVMASVFVFTVIFLVINLLVDLSYYLIDPRIRQ